MSSEAERSTCSNQSQHEISSSAHTGQYSFHFFKLSRWFSSFKLFLACVFSPRFDDKELERHFKGQEWYASKVFWLPVPAVRLLISSQILALASSCFLFL